MTIFERVAGALEQFDSPEQVFHRRLSLGAREAFEQLSDVFVFASENRRISEIEKLTIRGANIREAPTTQACLNVVLDGGGRG